MHVQVSEVLVGPGARSSSAEGLTHCAQDPVDPDRHLQAISKQNAACIRIHESLAAKCSAENDPIPCIV